jgi:hypothetical protein
MNLFRKSLEINETTQKGSGARFAAISSWILSPPNDGGEETDIGCGYAALVGVSRCRGCGPVW